ncbi:hypothetical protein [Aridibaculum aurantiacum]|uniref:hypothetical protein n=1 Tax=Aridibaculum aurantiacum TaxID=2810307 RepID=UPI001A977C0F|nr:hypothetical protein [Aridibaculum aurantiacum]
MKKLLAILVLGSFVACNSGESTTDADSTTTTTTVDTTSLTPVDTTTTIGTDTTGTGSGL